MLKKLFLTLMFLFAMACSPAWAVTYYAIHTGGTWSTAGTWSTISAKDATRVGGAVVPGTSDTCVLDDYSGNVTNSSGAAVATLDMTAYTNTLTMNSSITLTAGATLQGNYAGSSGNITVQGGGVTLAGSNTSTSAVILNVTTASQTLTSGGNTWSGKLTLSPGTNNIITLVGNWVNTGIVTFNSSGLAVNKTTAETLTCQNGLTISTGSMAASTLAGIIITGGTWSGSYNITTPLTINPSVSNVTISGAVVFGGSQFTYTPSTYVVVTTSSNFEVASNCNFNSAGIVFNNFTFYALVYNTSIAITLQSDLTITGILNYSSSGGATHAFLGAYNVTCGYIYLLSATTSYFTVSFAAGQTLTITSGIYTVSDINNTGVANYSLINSGTASSPTFIVYKGTLANLKVAGMAFTDVYFYGATPLYNYNGGTLTRTLRIKNVDATNINKKAINGYNGV